RPLRAHGRLRRTSARDLLRDDGTRQALAGDTRRDLPPAWLQPRNESGSGGGRGRHRPSAHARPPALVGRRELHDDGRRHARHPRRPTRHLRKTPRPILRFARSWSAQCVAFAAAPFITSPPFITKVIFSTTL